MKQLRLALLATSALVPLWVLPASANPLGPNVAAGDVSVNGVGSADVTVTQNSDRAIINWRSFDIAPTETTQFAQPSPDAVVLNRVTGGEGPSQVLGMLRANGQVFLVNPDGILIGKGATIDVGSLVATTHDLFDGDFLNGNYEFGLPGKPDASVVNLGTITVNDGGFAALVAPGVRNAGTITARLGKVALGAGSSFSLDPYGDSLITLGVSADLAGDIIDLSTGKPLKALVGNGGLIKADGGVVQLTAAATRKVIDSVINNSGTIEADTVGYRNGKIVLSAGTAADKPAGLPTQKVKVSGKLSTSGRNAGEQGGDIEITGEDIALGIATIEAFGWTGGGTVLVGGDAGGGDPNGAAVSAGDTTLVDHRVQTATALSVGAASSIDASATGGGNGGKVVLWSDGSTAVSGSVAARGGTASGNGGFVEVSGRQHLAFDGLVDTAAPVGKDGLLLFDPIDVVIGTSVGSTLTPATIVSALSSNNVKIVTSAGSGNGDIIVNEDINWTNANALTLSAYRDVDINAAVSNSGGAGVSLRADDQGTGVGTVAFGAAGSVSTTGDVNLYYNPNVNPAGSLVNASSYVGPTENFSPFITAASFTPYMLVNTVDDLQNIQNNLSGDYALGRDIDASQTANWNLGLGFSPIGTVGSSLFGFNGALDGQGHAISGLFINHAPAGPDDPTALVGLFSSINSSATVGNLTVSNARVTGASAGILADANWGIVSNVHVSGTVVASVLAGGLVAQNGLPHTPTFPSTIDGASSDAVVVGDTAGGLVGENFGGTISNSYSVGTVAANPPTAASGYSIAGGLVGTNWSNIANSYSGSTVVGSTGGAWNMTGGLVGTVYIDTMLPAPNISDSYAYGVVSGGQQIGGLVGATSSPTGATNYLLTDSYWDVDTTQQAASAGGTGLSESQLTGGLPSGFDPSIWGVDPNYNNGYPYLLWQKASAPSVTTLTGGPPIVAPPPPPPPPPVVHTYVMSGTGSVLSLADITGHSFAYGTFFVDTVTGVRYTPEQLGGTTLPAPPPPPPPPPIVHTYTASGTGAVLSLADIAGHSFPYGTFFIESGTGTRFTPEQLGGFTLPASPPPPPPPPPPVVHTYTTSGTGAVLSLAEIVGHSFPYGTLFIESETGTRFTPEQLGGTTLGPTPVALHDPSGSQQLQFLSLDSGDEPAFQSVGATPMLQAPTGVNTESWFAERNEIGVQYVLANDEVWKLTSDLVLSLGVKGELHLAGVDPEVTKLVDEFIGQLMQAWDANDASRRGEYWKAASVLSELAAQAFVDVFGKPVGVQYWLPVAKIATAAATAYVYGFGWGYPLNS